MGTKLPGENIMNAISLMRRHLKGAAAAALIAAAMLPMAAHAGPTLDKIKERGVIKVGVGTTPGFFTPDSNGRWQGFFVDFGRALAVTVFDDPDKVEFTNSSPQQRLPALQSGEFDDRPRALERRRCGHCAGVGSGIVQQ